MNILSYLRNFILPISEINRSLPVSGTIYEIGCGYGSLCFEIAAYSTERRVIGIDLNKLKIKEAQHNYETTNLSFVAEDAKRFSYKSCNGVIFSDFLHHVDLLSQLKILEIVTKNLENGGILILKEIVKDDGWRMWASRLWDFLLYPFDKINYRSRSEWEKILVEFKLEVEVKRHVSWFPGSTILFVCKK